MTFYDCRDAFLAPSEVDYFQGPNVDADEVDLTATHEDGKVVSKHSGYKNGKSTDSFNLAINTLFQRALLARGNNQIQYVLKKSGNIVSSGNFLVSVAEGKSLVCRPGYIDTFNDSLCNSPSMACDQYFSENNYCQ